MLTQQPLDYPAQQQLAALPVTWVKTQEDLFTLLDEIDATDTIALDTEFIKRILFFLFWH